MIFQRIKSEGIAHNSYFLGSGLDAAVIDPRRDCDVYTDLARRHGLRIRYIFETHRNEDYVIGSTALAAATGAEIYHGPGLDWRYGTTLEDGQEFRLSRLNIRATRTPGHTEESVSYVVTDRSSGGAPVMVFCGDTLFVSEVGRTDLYGPAEAPRLAGKLYDSLFSRLLPLGDGVIICPAHGAGSLCGMNIGDREESTIGAERLQNPMLQLTRDEFIARKVAEKPVIPPFFRKMEEYNLAGPPLTGGLPQPAPLRAREFAAEMEKGALVIDTSETNGYGGAHIAGAYSIWLEGLPVFGGWVLPYDRRLLLVNEVSEHLDSAVRFLFRAGYDNITGYLKGGIASWYGAGYPWEKLPLLEVAELRDRLEKDDGLFVLDVREQLEFEAGHIAGARNIYVGHLEERIVEVPDDRPVAVICTIGHRSGLGASILLRAGRKEVYNVPGGMTAWQAAGFPEIQV